MNMLESDQPSRNGLSQLPGGQGTCPGQVCQALAFLRSQVKVRSVFPAPLASLPVIVMRDRSRTPGWRHDVFRHE